MLPGIFMMLFLVAALYALTGLGRTMIMREGMQDAADAAAFSAAIMHARGMNLIAFINLLMMILVSVLVAIRLAQTLLAMGAVALSVASAFTFGATAPFVPLAVNGVETLENAYENAKNVVMPMLKGLHAVQRATSVVVPWVALADGMIEASSHHPPAKGALALPGALRLPVEPDKFSVLCDRAIEETSKIVVGASLGFIKEPPQLLTDVVSGAMSALLAPTTSKLCGDGTQDAPQHSEAFDSHQPQPSGFAACFDDAESSECKESVRESEQATPDQWTGECRESCRPDGPYARTERRARASCSPATGKNFSEYVWQERSGTGIFHYDGADWKLVRHVGWGATELLTTDYPPCGRGGSISEEWNDSGPTNQDEPDPLCIHVHTPNRTGSTVGREEEFPYDEALRLFSCAEKIDKKFDVANKEDQIGGEGSDSRSPHKIEDGVLLGSETFQIRAIAFGKAPGPGKAREAVHYVDRKLTRSEDDMGASFREFLLGAAELLGTVSAAQAEYYFDHNGTTEPAEWMWNMRWTARLKHFRLPSDDEKEKEDNRRSDTEDRTQQDLNDYGDSSDAPTAQGSCENSGGNECEKTNERAEWFDGWVRH